MIALGDWTPVEPLQGVALTRLHGDLYDLRAAGVMSGLVPDDVPAPGVLRYQSASRVCNESITATDAQIKGFASYFRGVAHRINGGWLIRGIAPQMRKETK